jgi:hypothetical protein
MVMVMKDNVPEDRTRPPEGLKWSNEKVISEALVQLVVLNQVTPLEVIRFETSGELALSTLTKLENFVESQVKGRVQALSKYSDSLEKCLTYLEDGHKPLVSYELRGETDEGVKFERTLEEIKTDFVKYYWLRVDGLKAMVRPIFAEMQAEMTTILAENQALSHANLKLTQEKSPTNSKKKVPWYKRIFSRKTKP